MPERGGREASVGQGHAQRGGERWPKGSARPVSGVKGSASVFEVVGRLVEHEVWYGPGLGGVEGRSLIRDEITLGWPTGARNGRSMRWASASSNGPWVRTWRKTALDDVLELELDAAPFLSSRERGAMLAFNP